MMTQDPNLSVNLLERKMYWSQKKISWSAVLTGAMIAFGLTLLFNILSVGIGLSVLDTNDQGIKNLALHGFIWTIVGNFIILFIAGWKTGKLIKICPKELFCRSDDKASSVSPSSSESCRLHKHCFCTHGMTHGFLAWVLYLMISLVFLLFAAHIASTSLLRASFLNIPLEYAQTQAMNTPTSNVNQVINNATSNQQNRLNAPTVQKAHKAGADTIGLFLVMLLGAVGCAIGSYLGALAHRKHIEALCADKR